MISLQTPHNDSLELTNNISIGNFSSTPQQILSSMYQTAAPQYQPLAVYGNTHITYTSNHHSRNSSTSSISRHSPTDSSSFALETNGYTQLSYRFDPSVNSATTSAMNAQDVSKSSPLQQNHSSPNLIQAGSSPSPSVTLSPDNNSSNVLPPISEVFSSSAHNGQSTSSSSSPVPSQVVPQSQQPQNGGGMMPSAASAHSGYFYSDAAAAAAAATFAAAAHAQQVAAQAAEGAANFPTSIVSQSQQSQLAPNIPGVDPRNLPRIGANASDMQALSNAIDRNRNNSMLAINTAGLTVGTGDPSPMSASSSTGSPIMPALGYHHHSAHHQALLNSHFMAATQSMNNSAGLIAPTQRVPANHNRRNTRSDDGNDIGSASNGDRPQKVYSFVALPGINTKKRPRRRYDEIERHYACNFSGCTKSYGTLNHLNAHVQMQKHGPKRHPSEFKELRKQWRRQKREEEERKNAESNVSKSAAAGLNISLPSI